MLGVAIVGKFLAAPASSPGAVFIVRVGWAPERRPLIERGGDLAARWRAAHYAAACSLVDLRVRSAMNASITERL